MEKKRVLIVEDEILPAMYLKQMLNAHGYYVLPIATGGQEAVDFAIASGPDVLIMDIYLNNHIDGIEVVEHVQKFCSIPVVYISALCDSQTRKRAQKTNPVSFIDKPFDEQELLTVLEQV